MRARKAFRLLSGSLGQHAFTLTALLCGVALTAVLAGVAAGTHNRWLPALRLKQAGREIYTFLQLAKQTAVKENRLCAVTFNQNIDGRSYDMVVYSDLDADLCYDAGEPVLRALELSRAAPGVALDTSRGGGDGLTFAANAESLPSVAFSPTGLPVNPSGGFGAGSVSLCNQAGKSLRVVLSSAGNIRII